MYIILFYLIGIYTIGKEILTSKQKRKKKKKSNNHFRVSIFLT